MSRGVADINGVKDEDAAEVGLGHFGLEPGEALSFESGDIDSFVEINGLLAEQVTLGSESHHGAPPYIYGLADGVIILPDDREGYRGGEVLRRVP